MTHIKGLPYEFLMSSKCRNVGVSVDLFCLVSTVIQIRRGWGRGRGPLHNLLILLTLSCLLGPFPGLFFRELKPLATKVAPGQILRSQNLCAVNDSSQDSSFLAMFFRMSEIVKSFISNLCIVYGQMGLEILNEN